MGECTYPPLVFALRRNFLIGNDWIARLFAEIESDLSGTRRASYAGMKVVWITRESIDCTVGVFCFEIGVISRITEIFLAIGELQSSY